MTQAVPQTAEQDSGAPVGEALGVAGVALFSEQPAALAAFYGMLLGLRFERRQHDDGREHRIAQLGGVQVEIKAARTAGGEPTSDWGSHEPAGASGVEVSFEVPDAAAACEYAVTLGAAELQAAQELAWGTWGVVRDPDGNRLGLWSRPGNETDNEDGAGA